MGEMEKPFTNRDEKRMMGFGFLGEGIDPSFRVPVSELWAIDP